MCAHTDTALKQVGCDLQTGGVKLEGRAAWLLQAWWSLMWPEQRRVVKRVHDA